MASPQGPSFIPKQPAHGKIRRRHVRKIYVFAYVSFVLFFGTLIASAGTFLYKVSVETQLENEKQKLVEQREQFNEADIARVRELNQRLIAAKNLLDNHISVLSLFESLQSSTIESVQITSFDLTQDEVTGIQIKLEATTENFNSVLFQRSVVSANPVLDGATFEELIGKKENIADTDILLPSDAAQIVTFLITKSLSPAEIPYTPRNNRQERSINETQNELSGSGNESSSDSAGNDNQSTQ